MSGELSVVNLGKSYRQWGSEWRRLASWFLPAIKPLEEHWTLKEVNFSIAPGEAMGIVGENGAGKSTLLKLITGVIFPTQGEVKVKGRIAAILELGMGFSPDLTGRQNAYHSAGLMGYSQAEVRRVMPEIEAFAEVGDYFDQPVRTYSSGMQMRVAFAVATAFKPDLLIVDEALSVGDVYFQQKCYERINQFTRQGMALLFVSHSMEVILSLCSRALLLRHGRVVCDGTPNDVVNLYHADIITGLDKGSEHSKTIQSDHTDLSSHFEEEARGLERVIRGKAGSIYTEAVHCIGAQLFDRNGCETNTLIADEETTLALTFRVLRDLDDPHVGFKIRNRFGVVLFETNTHCMKQSVGALEAGGCLTVRFTFPLHLNAEEYTITSGFANGGFGQASFRETLSYLHEVAVFSVLPNRKSIIWAGLINLNPQVIFEKKMSYETVMG